MACTRRLYNFNFQNKFVLSSFSDWILFRLQYDTNNSTVSNKPEKFIFRSVDQVIRNQGFPPLLTFSRKLGWARMKKIAKNK